MLDFCCVTVVSVQSQFSCQLLYLHLIINKNNCALLRVNKELQTLYLSRITKLAQHLLFLALKMFVVIYP